MKIYIDTLGCFKNLEDSERAAGMLAQDGFSFTDDERDADVVIVNTCGFIEDAKRESIDRILELVPLKQDGKKLIVTGCLTQRYASELAEELPEVDAFLGVNDYGSIAKIVREITAAPAPEESSVADAVHSRGNLKQNKILTEGRTRIFADGAPGLLSGPRKALGTRHTAFLKLAEGCSNRCSYCAIPAIRGPYRSVPERDVLADAERLAQEGARELVLIAQDVSAWGVDIYGEYALPRLLTQLCQIEGPEWIRLMYCYEDRITDELIETIAREEKICRYIDIPLQHYSDRVLARMNRKSTRAGIERSLQKLRRTVPDIAIRTTFMTGFPGETEADFLELDEFIREQGFARLGVFAFSPEDGTPAADMAGQVPREIAENRRDALMLAQLDISLAHNRTLVGRTLKVLVESREEDGVYVGRTEYDAPEIDNSVIFEADSPDDPEIRLGDFVSVRVTDAMDYDIIGAREISL